MTRLLVFILICLPVTAFSANCPCTSAHIPEPGTFAQVLRACGNPDKKINLSVDPRNVSHQFRDPAVIKYQAEVKRSLRPEDIPPRKVMFTKFYYDKCLEGVLNFEDGILSLKQEGL